MNYWLMKSEPDVFSIDDLKKTKSEPWDGVRNYQARNFMRDMAVKDLVFFYHSNCKPPGIVGIAEVCKTAYPDHTALDSKSKYFDAKSSADHIRWSMVDLKFREKFDEIIPLEDLKKDESLGSLALVQKGSRLSIMPVAPVHWKRICGMT